ncbi:hypothetical protein CSKR_105536 [Clonorchis sinensis]|uniref:SWIM-type domain-containing protein n=1 Tax=Clonorchis sinensis TaxID=79923 RepID=A0A3R7F5T1_CLOSI|nr:hypothetical protein CSKR_105536 [Clonorchis sinensis]
MEIPDYVRNNYGIDLTGDDVRVLRDKLCRLDNPACDLQGTREALRTFGPMAVSVCDDGSLNAIINRNEQLEARYRRLVSVPLVRGRPGGATLPSHLQCLGWLTPYAQERVCRNYNKGGELAHSTYSYLIFRDGNKLPFGQPMKCPCSLLLPCRHMAFAAEYHGQPPLPLVESGRRLLPLNGVQPSASGAINRVSVQAAPKGKSSKLSVARKISSDICEAIVRLGSSDFGACCLSLRTFADQVCAGHVPSCVLSTEGVTRVFRAEMRNAASTSLAPSGDGISSLAVEAPVRCDGQPSTSNTIICRRAQKSLLPFYEDKMAGLDESFDLQDDNYYLQCIKLRDHKVRTAEKYGTVAPHHKEPMVSHIDADVCNLFDGACEGSKIDLVQCDHCHVWPHCRRIGSLLDRPTFFCPMCARHNRILE